MEEFVTLAVHTKEKASILENILAMEGIAVMAENITGLQQGIKIKVRKEDLHKALYIVENRKLFSYSDEGTLKYDDNKKRILVPVDFSEYSMQACILAFNLARDIDAKVKIIHVYFNPFYPAQFIKKQGQRKENESVMDMVRINIQALCNEIDRKMQFGELPSVNYSYMIKEGLPEEEIVLFANDYKPSLIVMGTRGADQKEGDLIGSVTANVIEMSHYPIIAIPDNTAFSDLRKITHIAFLSNFSLRDITSFSTMMDILYPFQIKIDIIHIAMNQDEVWDEKKLSEVKSIFDTKYPTIEIRLKQIQEDHLLDGLDVFIKNENIDILALTTSKRNIFMRMFRPSISRKMLYHSNVPLFVLRG